MGSPAFQKKRRIFAIFMPMKMDVQNLSTMTYAFGTRLLENVQTQVSPAWISLLKKPVLLLATNAFGMTLLHHLKRGAFFLKKHTTARTCLSHYVEIVMMLRC
jgi:hypothetical protein